MNRWFLFLHFFGNLLLTNISDTLFDQKSPVNQGGRFPEGDDRQTLQLFELLGSNIPKLPGRKEHSQCSCIVLPFHPVLPWNGLKVEEEKTRHIWPLSTKVLLVSFGSKEISDVSKLPSTFIWKLHIFAFSPILAIGAGDRSRPPMKKMTSFFNSL